MSGWGGGATSTAQTGGGWGSVAELSLEEGEVAQSSDDDYTEAFDDGVQPSDDSEPEPDRPAAFSPARAPRSQHWGPSGSGGNPPAFAFKSFSPQTFSFAAGASAQSVSFTAGSSTAFSALPDRKGAVQESDEEEESDEEDYDEDEDSSGEEEEEEDEDEEHEGAAGVGKQVAFRGGSWRTLLKQPAGGEDSSDSEGWETDGTGEGDDTDDDDTDGTVANDDQTDDSDEEDGDETDGGDQAATARAGVAGSGRGSGRGGISGRGLGQMGRGRGNARGGVPVIEEPTFAEDRTDVDDDGCHQDTQVENTAAAAPHTAADGPPWQAHVAKLPPRMTEPLLLSLFRGFGATKATLSPPVGSGSGFGVVTFGTASNLQRAIDDPPETEWPDVSRA